MPGDRTPTQYYPQRRWVPHNSGQVMVYVVMLEDPFASHFCGVCASIEAANKFIEMQEREAVCGEQYTISEVSVHN
jgi:hypothetical protein